MPRRTRPRVDEGFHVTPGEVVAPPTPKVTVSLHPFCIPCGARLVLASKGVTAPSNCKLIDCHHRGVFLKVPTVDLEVVE